MFQFRLEETGNGTFMASIYTPDKNVTEAVYDHDGAVKYVFAVLIVYGMSIIIMIASLVRKSQKGHDEDGSVESYFKDIHKIRMAEKQQRKQRTIAYQAKQERVRCATLQGSGGAVLGVLPTAILTLDLVNESGDESGTGCRSSEYRPLLTRNKLESLTECEELETEDEESYDTIIAAKELKDAMPDCEL